MQALHAYGYKPFLSRAVSNIYRRDSLSPYTTSLLHLFFFFFFNDNWSHSPVCSGTAALLTAALVDLWTCLTLWFFRESEFRKDADEEKASLQKSISLTSALLTEKDAELEKLRNEVTVLRGENATAKSLHSVVQTLESDKVKLELKVKNLELQLKENKRQLSSSSGNTDAQAEEDERAQESQQMIDFLNSVIVDLQRKNQDLKMKVEMMSEAALNGNGEDLNSYDSDDQEKQSKKKPRLFCDICDCFDLHDTEDCPTQAQMSEDPPHSTHHGSRSEERPYCEICEMFGHWATNCNDDETFWGSREGRKGFPDKRRLLSGSRQHWCATSEELLIFWPLSTNLRKYFDLQQVSLSFPLVS